MRKEIGQNCCTPAPPPEPAAGTIFQEGWVRRSCVYDKTFFAHVVMKSCWPLGRFQSRATDFERQLAKALRDIFCVGSPVFWLRTCERESAKSALPHHVHPNLLENLHLTKVSFGGLAKLCSFIKSFHQWCFGDLLALYAFCFGCSSFRADNHAFAPAIL